MKARANILIISNHANHRVAYAAGLAGYGYNVHEATTLDEAHDLISINPGVVVLDLRLSSMSTSEVARFTGAVNARLIVIGNSADEQAVAQQLNAHHFLSRPANLDELLESIA